MVLRAPTDFILRCLFKCQILFKSEISHFVLLGSHGIFQGRALETVFFCAIFVETYSINAF